MKVATFYPNWTSEDVNMLHGYRDTLRALARGVNVHTTQMCLLDSAKDYDVIRILETELLVRKLLPVEGNHSNVIVITNNHDGSYSLNGTSRVLWQTNSIFRLWEMGEFETDD